MIEYFSDAIREAFTRLKINAIDYARPHRAISVPPRSPSLRTWFNAPGHTPGASDEVLFYEIEKWSVDADNNPLDLIQSIFVPNTPLHQSTRNSQKNFNFYDTQVKFGKKYIYRVYSYVVIYGTSYSYRLDTLAPNDTDTTLNSDLCIFSLYVQ